MVAANELYANFKAAMNDWKILFGLKQPEKGLVMWNGNSEHCLNIVFRHRHRSQLNDQSPAQGVYLLFQSFPSLPHLLLNPTALCK